ncbi:hypothetical protein CFC21_037387 [Triticum aestivum]|uniref:Bidirectional sugar transporter SWEET n=2 Tax=Triticum aestivum TaxID=4565 RepID=A0A3B6EN14_WHEAT|nr:hypothetical protein CFC21_037387 [Triticum aestivum]
MEHIARFFFGVSGNVIALFLFLSPVYGLPFVSPNNILVTTINGAGSVIEAIYVVIFLIFAERRAKVRMLGLLSVVTAIFATVVLVSLLALHGKARTVFCGLAATVFSICMYASPLSIMRLVIKTKSVEYMPFLLSLSVFLCGTSWFIYGLLGLDPFIYIPNGCGSFLGLMQLILYAIYRKNKGPAAGAGKGEDADDADEVEDAKKAAAAVEMGEAKIKVDDDTAVVDEPAVVDKVAAQV